MILGGREMNTELLEIMKMDIKRCEVLSGERFKFCVNCFIRQIKTGIFQCLKMS